jgi:hypothetical protein
VAGLVDAPLLGRSGGCDAVGAVGAVRAVDRRRVSLVRAFEPVLFRGSGAGYLNHLEMSAFMAISSVAKIRDPDSSRAQVSPIDGI